MGSTTLTSDQACDSLVQQIGSSCSFILLQYLILWLVHTRRRYTLLDVRYKRKRVEFITLRAACRVPPT